ncbi:MAG: hypothetical protein MR332_10005, partial [Fusicatenibacter sp.]|nr:hypothetical protein [Fusicatenibacter sp.]
KGRDGQDKQEKTCRKTQHVKEAVERDVPKTICHKAAVGENYNSTWDTMKIIISKDLFENRIKDGAGLDEGYY